MPTQDAAARLRALSRWPIVVAPMAGGPSTTAMVVAAAEAGACGFLAGGYKSAATLEAEMSAVRAATDRPFGVNLFVPGLSTTTPEALAVYVRQLEADAAVAGVTLGDPSWDDDAYPAKLASVLAEPPALVTFTFGCPEADAVERLQAAGALVGVTVTTPEEAAVALALRVDFLCLQGCEAGGHRGHFDNLDRPDQDRPLSALMATLRRRTRVPLVAAGGISNASDVVWALRAGAAMVQCGTAFLRCPESGAHAIAKAALVHPLFATGAVTRAFSGRRARALTNRFMLEHPDAPAAYPEINNATRPLRAAAASGGDPHGMSLYAGTGAAQARPHSVAEVIADLVSGLPR
ncbi:MAG TPA: nitronate monooxygenase [Acidimicrobiales bacterium]